MPCQTTGVGYDVTRGGLTVLDIPDDCYASVSFSQMANTQVSTSPFSKYSQTNELPGSLWSASITFSLYSDDTPDHITLGKIRAFLLKLRGAAGRFRVSDKTWKGIGSWAGTAQCPPSTSDTLAGATSISINAAQTLDVELVTDGSGDTLTDWAARPIYGLIALDAGRIKVTHQTTAGASFWGVTPVTCEIGETYNVTMTYDKGTTVTNTFGAVFNSSNATIAISDIVTTTGSVALDFEFTATETTHWVGGNGYSSDVTDRYFLIDNISVKKVLSVSSTALLSAGDYIQIDDQMVMVTADLESSGTTITFEPPLVHPTTAGAIINTLNPAAVMRLVDDNQVNFQRNEYNYSDRITIEAVQAL